MLPVATARATSPSDRDHLQNNAPKGKATSSIANSATIRLIWKTTLEFSRMGRKARAALSTPQQGNEIIGGAVTQVRSSPVGER